MEPYGLNTPMMPLSSDIFNRLGISNGAAFAINGSHRADLTMLLSDGDVVSIFRQGAVG